MWYNILIIQIRNGVTMKVISKNLLKSYTRKLVEARENYQKEIQEDQEQYQKDFDYAGQQFANVRRNERKPLLDDSKAAIQKEADLLIKNLKILNNQYIKDNFKAGQTPENKKKLDKFMALSGGKVNEKIIDFLVSIGDYEALEFLQEDKNNKIQTKITGSLRELKAGDPIVNQMIEILENGKEMNMYNSAIKVFCDKLDSIVDGAADLEPMTPEEALEYLRDKANGIVDDDMEIRYQMYKLQRGNNNV